MDIETEQRFNRIAAMINKNRLLGMPIHCEDHGGTVKVLVLRGLVVDEHEFINVVVANDSINPVCVLRHWSGVHELRDLWLQEPA
jgi:hypothetical protein